MGSLVTNASPFLFPCKIEYSLICAVILYEMWKNVKTVKVKLDKEKTKSAPNLHHTEPFGSKLLSFYIIITYFIHISRKFTITSITI